MKNFKNKFIVLLNYMDKSKIEKFALNNNIYFNTNNYEKMEKDFKSEIINILNFVKNENQIYLNLNKEKTESFINQNKTYLDKIINNIDAQLSELNLNNLNNKYSEMLNLIFNSINQVIETNKKLAVEYLSSVINSGSSHCTQLYLNKVNIYFDSFKSIKNIIETNFKNITINIYKNIINQIKNIIVEVKLNPVFKTYQTQIPFVSNHLSLIDIIIVRFDKYISDKIFNNNYLTQ